MVTPDELLWQTAHAVPDRTGEDCPCGAELKRPAEWCYGVCDVCRDSNRRKACKRPVKPDFVDVPLPLDWGQP
jgi:hypothetical protein